MSLNDFNVHLFQEGTHECLWEVLGAHPGGGGTEFAVWAPHAAEVAVAGDFNAWEPHRLEPRRAGLWAGFVPAASAGSLYKYRIVADGREMWKADPFAVRSERPPGTASVIWNLDYDWGDSEWMNARQNAAGGPMTIYEVHLGSWRRVPEERGRPLTYREAAPRLAAYLREMGFSHVELLPLLIHPFYGSWGYQITGFFAPDARYGTPQDFMFLVDTLHRHGVGVILDWVPSHFAGDEHGLAEFDGTELYERGRDEAWNSPLFDYARPEVRSFLRSSAMYWLERFHVDGLRLDAVAAIRARENGEAFLRELTGVLRDRVPSAVLIAEDSSPAGGVTASPRDGGLGFDLKWDMGWMHDTLEYFTKPPEARASYHGKLTFRPLYLRNERWVLPLSHDEVKPPFGSLLKKMPGDLWQQFANLRLLLAWMYAQPGKKLLFMGDEFAQWQEWNHDVSLDWHLLDLPSHGQIRNLTGFLNWVYQNDAALYESDADERGFEWIDCCDEAHSVVSLLRRGHSERQVLSAVFNFSSDTRSNYRIGVPVAGVWKEVLNTDATHYGGSGRGNFGSVEATPIPWHNHPHSLNLLLPPLASVWLKPGA